jgi:hypothetical protein
MKATLFSIRTLSTVILLAFCLAPNVQSQDQSLHHSVVPLNKFAPGQWVEKVWGDPSKPGEPFVIRIHNDAGYLVLPHYHLIDENITVVKGSWALGSGKKFDKSRLEPMEVGTFGIAPKTMPHFAQSETETIVQVHGIGPFSSMLVDPVYEVTDKGTFVLTSLLQPGTATSSSPPDCFALKVGAHVRGDRGEGTVVSARCSPANRITEYWVRKSDDKRFWATLQELKAE